MENELVLQIQSNHTIALNNDGNMETYDLNVMPDPASTLVVNEKAKLLTKMNLGVVIQNLNNSVDLLDVAYHAVYGFPVHKNIWKLQESLMKLNDNGIDVIQDFSIKSLSIVAELNGVFRLLTKGAEELAIKKLGRFSSIANGMSKQAQKLAEEYRNLSDVTGATVETVMDEHQTQIMNQDQMLKEMSEYKAEQEAADAAKKAIKDRLANLQREYDKLNKAELDQEKHERTMDIISAVFTFLGNAAAIAADGASNMGPKDSNKKDENLDAAKKEDADAKAELSKLQTEKSDLQTAFDAEENSEKKEKLRADIRDKDKQIVGATEKANTKASTLSNLSKVFHDTAAASQPTSASSARQDNRSIRLTEINRELLKLEEEQTNQLANLAKYTKRLEGMVIEENSIEAAVRSLIVALSCLKNVVAALDDIVVFWKAMEVCCRAISAASIFEDIKDIQNMDKADRIELYYSDSVMLPLLTYMVQWSAISSISQDYIEAAGHTRERLKKSITTADNPNVSREQHWDLASKTAAVVTLSLEKQVAHSKAKEPISI